MGKVKRPTGVKPSPEVCQEVPHCPGYAQHESGRESTVPQLHLRQCESGPAEFLEEACGKSPHDSESQESGFVTRCDDASTASIVASRSGVIRSAAPYQRMLTRHRPSRDKSARYPSLPSTRPVNTMLATLGPAIIARNTSGSSRPSCARCPEFPLARPRRGFRPR